MRVALTGGATGIGAATAAKLKAGGAEVVVFDINQPSANIDDWVQIDLADPASIAVATGQVHGRFDALINNAGLPPREGLTEAVLAVNYFGLVSFTEAMAGKLERGAAMVNVASRAGAKWRDNLGQVKALMALGGVDDLPGFIAEQDVGHVRAYDLSKEAVIVWTIGQTERFLARGLRVNTVSPAAVSTGILNDFKVAFGARADKVIDRAGRPGEPEEIADIICFLASPKSRWLKGVDVIADGGITAMQQSDTLGLSS